MLELIRGFGATALPSPMALSGGDDGFFGRDPGEITVFGETDSQLAFANKLVELLGTPAPVSAETTHRSHNPNAVAALSVQSFWMRTYPPRGARERGRNWCAMVRSVAPRRWA